jgi:hypothetical protein
MTYRNPRPLRYLRRRMMPTRLPISRMVTARQPSLAAISRAAARIPFLSSWRCSGTFRIRCLNGAIIILSLGCALKAAHPLRYTLFEGYVAGPLLFLGGEDYAPLQGADLAATRPAGFGQLSHALDFTSRERPSLRRGPTRRQGRHRRCVRRLRNPLPYSLF